MQSKRKLDYAASVAQRIESSRPKKPAKVKPQTEILWSCSHCSLNGMFTLPEHLATSPASFEVSLGIHRTLSMKCKFTGHVKMTSREDKKPGFQIQLL